MKEEESFKGEKLDLEDKKLDLFKTRIRQLSLYDREDGIG